MGALIELGTDDRRALAKHEKTIEAGLASFVDVGNALIAIRDGGLYTATATTFEAYCKTRWGFSKPRAYQLIDAAKVVASLSTMVYVASPPNERIARVLADLPSENVQADVWTKAVETAKKGKDGKPKLTASHVQAVADEVAPQQPKQKPARGKPMEDMRLFKTLESKIGECVRLNSEIKKQHGGADHHEAIRRNLNHVLNTLATWKSYATAPI